MPIAGNNTIAPVQPLFFATLAELDAWADVPSRKFEDILPYVARNETDATTGNKGKLLICHDYKGGYIESPFALSYTFNFWSTCDTFVYFAHQRVTVPPPGWISAAHRQGVKMLGVLIFENSDAQADLLQLFFGPLPDSALSSLKGDKQSASPPSLPFSSHYARVLAELAYQRGFDGYLMNFEWSLPGGISMARALAAWVSLLREELWKRVGPHAEVVWYDSVTALGYLSWQDRLNAYNLPYFLSSTAFFSNYTWSTDYPTQTVQYFNSLDPNILEIFNDFNANSPPKSLQLNDVQVGVDVWGRGTFGGGGYGTYRALEYVGPQTQGLSAALFAPGWTWETKETNSDRTWEQWWDDEVSLWAGLRPGFVLPPSLAVYKQRRREQPKVASDPYKPIAEFFSIKPPPDPSTLAFMTIFSPGIGRAWWVNGVKVWDGTAGNTWTAGWQDVERQTSVGDLVWPVPKLEWNNGSTEGATLPNCTVDLALDDAWNGGSSLLLSVSDPAGLSQASIIANAARSVFVPIQSLSLTGGIPYVATAVYKLQNIKDGVTVGIGLKVVPLSVTSTIDIKIDDAKNQNGASINSNGDWTGVGAQVTVSSSEHTDVALGIVITITQTTAPTTDGGSLFSLLLGQMNVFSFPSPNSSLSWQSTLLWADFAALPNTAADEQKTATTLGDVNGTLTWEVEISLLPEDPETHPISGPEDPIPVFGQVPADDSWVEKFAYWNIYAQLLPPGSGPSSTDVRPADAVWIGTSGVDYGGDVGWRSGRFIVVGDNVVQQLPQVTGAQVLRFYVQGFSERGDVTPWSDVVSFDYSLNFTT
ncbi:glycosyl hydrolase family 85-domain-containing protein [Cyathus striatus]|nr:glycosyl hydrolase family 85-domain-containing protein [Cyathus striatus]